MESIEERFDVTGIPRRSAYLLVQLLLLYVVAVFSLGRGVLGLPVAIGTLYLAIYACLTQVTGVIEDRLDR